MTDNPLMYITRLWYGVAGETRYILMRDLENDLKSFNGLTLILHNSAATKDGTPIPMYAWNMGEHANYEMGIA